MQTLYVTTPIYYVNAKPHIGHAYTTIVCDVFTRFNKMLGKNVKFVTGTDEHGKKIEQSATKAGLDPKKFTDNISQLFRDILPVLNIFNNDFIRTTEERHKKAVSAIWNKLSEKGYIYLGEYSGWYDIRNEAYFSEDELIDGKSPLGGEVTIMKEECYFFKLSEFEDKLLKFYDENPDFIFPETRRNEVLSFVKGGLKDLAISRASFKWGIPVPNDPKHVIYVWVDALTNYLTMLGYPHESDMNNNQYWQNSIHFVGKEIVRFHAVYWPALLMASGIRPPKQIVAHGWWMSEGEKMSKSLGNVQDPVKYCKLFGSDSLRYFLLRELSFGSDGNFSLEGFIGRYNGVLANAYGNLCKRVLSIAQKNCSGIVKKTEDEADFIKEIEKILNETIELVEKYAFNRYLEKVETAIAFANQYVDQQKPWAIEDQNALQNILHNLLIAIIQITKFFEPVIPIAASKVLSQIKVLDNKDIVVTNSDDSLFPRIDASKIGEFDVFERE
ncbi:MAG: methionine--tRNA ligase [Holosporales bacterium]|jgi:methionyl-tRNA synthetase|nr:methionine--tRNA ligase [Holosporales bacterium]